MIVLKATQEQYNALNGYKNGNSILNFAKDGNGNWIVGLSVLTDPAFLEIRNQLSALEKIDYVPQQEEIF